MGRWAIQSVGVKYWMSFSDVARELRGQLTWPTSVICYDKHESDPTSLYSRLRVTLPCVTFLLHPSHRDPWKFKINYVGRIYNTTTLSWEKKNSNYIKIKMRAYIISKTTLLLFYQLDHNLYPKKKYFRVFHLCNIIKLH